jgi:predicted nicotinamide N-methyase
LPHELQPVPFHAGGVSLHVWCARDLDALLDRLLADQDGQVDDDDIPYYAHLWPSARVLAEEVARGPSLHGVTVLELGCGVGLPGLAAAARGATVSLTDLQPGALELATRGACQAGLQDRVRAITLDWRWPDHAPVDMVLGSDVLYEARFAEPVARALHLLLKPGGVALLSDPDRPHRRRWEEQATALGLAVRAGPTRDVEDGGRVHLLAVGRGPDGRRAPWEHDLTPAPDPAQPEGRP